MMLKSLSLAAGLAVTATLAQAADLGRPAPAAVDYVKVCDAYGEGFFYIPGGETCLKVGGYVRAEWRVFDFEKRFAAVYADNGTSSPTSNNYQSRARATINLDARTNTEFGLLRSAVEVYFTVDSGNFGAPSVTLQSAVIQWGGLTAGRTQSFFDFYLGDHYSSYFETAHSDTILNVLAYTFSFNSAVSASISIEDSTTGAATRRWSTADGLTPIPVGTYGGNKYPDIVGNLKGTGDWGSAQIMAAAHNVQGVKVVGPNGLGGTLVGGSDNDKWGYAIGGGATIKLPMIGASDAWSIQAAYSEGAVSYVSPDWFFANDYTAFRNNLNGGSRSGSIRLTEAWSVASGFTHGWNDAWTTGLTVSYADIDHKTLGKAYDFGQFDAGANLVWSGPSGLTIGGEIEYKHVDFKAKGDGSTDAWVGLLRIERKY